ncbi:MAG TPA: uroporphyrinogen decarboxylase family protein [Phycisphaerae bacterium]|nr:uroporphyrinogen decarboxylase family protein [Phycisphaerae bacterium]
MPLSHRENYLRNASFKGHEWIPQSVCISGAYWHQAREGMEAIALRHPVLFPGFRKGQVNFDAFARKAEQRRVVDAWGCTWHYEIDGLDGQVIAHPLEDWASLETWKPPQPPVMDEKTLTEFRDRKARGELATCYTEHGFLFLRLMYLRGFTNLMLDMGGEDPRLDKLIDTITGYWEQVFAPYLAEGVDLVVSADDLGTQRASLMGPKYFRRYLLPAYGRLFAPARKAGAHVYMHHDGYVMDIIDQIIESGVTIVNPQDLVNGIDNLARHVKGRVCIEIDVDRQKVVPFGSPGEVRELVREEVLKLGSPAGGLQMVVGIYPPTPLENVEALCSAFEEFRTYWVGR